MHRLTEAKLTALVGGVGFLILLAGQSDSPDMLGRYSWRYLLVLAVYALIMLGAAGLLTRSLPVLPGGLVLAGAALGLLIVAWLPLLSYSRLSSVTLKLSFTWVILTVAMRSRAVVVHWRAAVIGSVLLFQVVSLLTLENYPDMHISDEGWEASVGWTFARQGTLYSGVNQGVFGVPERFVPIANALPGYWFEVAGVGLWQARLIAFCGGLVLLVALYAAAQALYGERDVALFAVLAVAGTYPFLLNSHFFRLETYLSAAGLFALYLYLRAETHPRWALAAGLVLAGAVEIHQNALLLCLGSGLFLIGRAAYRALRRRPAVERRDLYFAVGGVLGGLLFVALHILPDPAEFMRQYHNSMRYRDAVYAAGNYDQWGPLRVVAHTVELYQAGSPVELAVAGIVVVLALRHSPERGLLGLLIGILAAFTLFAPTVHNYYLLYFVPLLSLMGAGLLRGWIAERRATAIVLCLALMLPMAWTLAQAERDGRNTRLLDAFGQVASSLEPDARVAAPQIFFFVMPDDPHLMALFMPRYAHMADPDVDMSQVWARYHPDVFVLYGPEEDEWGATYRRAQHFVETERITDSHLPFDVIVWQRPVPAPASE